MDTLFVWWLLLLVLCADPRLFTWVQSPLRREIRLDWIKSSRLSWMEGAAAASKRETNRNKSSFIWAVYLPDWSSIATNRNLSIASYLGWFLFELVEELRAFVEMLTCKPIFSMQSISSMAQLHRWTCKLNARFVFNEPAEWESVTLNLYNAVHIMRHRLRSSTITCSIERQLIAGDIAQPALNLVRLQLET